MLTDQIECSILVADDDQDDCFLMKKAMADGGVKNQVRFLEDGRKLLDYLGEKKSGQPGKGPPALPCLILLDLNMPRLDGRETLRLLKEDPRFQKIPVVILTNSRNPEDVEKAYQDGAVSFVTKPAEYKDMVSLMALLKIYWFQTVKLPI